MGRRASRHCLPGYVTGPATLAHGTERGGRRPPPWRGRAWPGVPAALTIGGTSKWLWGTGSGTCRQPLPSGLITSTCSQCFEARRLPEGRGRGKWGGAQRGQVRDGVLPLTHALSPQGWGLRLPHMPSPGSPRQVGWLRGAAVVPPGRPSPVSHLQSLLGVSRPGHCQNEREVGAGGWGGRGWEPSPGDP